MLLLPYGQEGAGSKPAYEAGFRSLDRNCAIPIPTIQNCGLSSIDQALKKLNRMTASAKRSLIDACAKTIDFDGKTTETEIQILRGITVLCPVLWVPISNLDFFILYLCRSVRGIWQFSLDIFVICPDDHHYF